MCWHMRGGLTYDEAMALSFQEREIINDIIKEHMETTNKTGLPYFDSLSGCVQQPVNSLRSLTFFL